MKCPHCGYVDSWDGESLKVVNGKYGEFYELPIVLKRNAFSNWGEQERTLYACPAEDCGKTFIDN